MPSFVNNSSYFFHIDASSLRPCTDKTGDDGFSADILVWASRLADEVKIAAPIAIARTTVVAIRITNFLLTIFCVHAQ